MARRQPVARPKSPLTRFATPAVFLALLTSLAVLAPARLFRWDAQGDDAHRFYDALALLQSVVMPDISLTCMNYGWAHEDATTDLRGDQAYCLQLYDAVVRAAVERSFDGAAQAAVGSSAGGLLRGLDVAEIGCGRGGGAALVWDLHRPKRYVAMDASARQLSAARRRHGDASGVEFVQASFGAPLPLETDSIDVLFSIEAMHTSGRHLHRFYGEVARVLRRGGTFAFADLRNTSAGGFPMPLRASGLTPVVQADITEGVILVILEYCNDDSRSGPCGRPGDGGRSLTMVVRARVRMHTASGYHGNRGSATLASSSCAPTIGVAICSPASELPPCRARPAPSCTSATTRRAPGRVRARSPSTCPRLPF